MRTFTRALICIAILAIACGTMLAADHSAPRQVVVKSSGIVHPMVAPKLTTIYSNLGNSTDTYYDGDGWLVCGSGSSEGESQWIGMSFTPKKAATATEVEIALEYDNSGTNAAEVAVATSSGGLPSKNLATWDVKNLPTIGTCCKLVTVKSKKGIKLSKAEYYVLGLTDSKSENSLNGWMFTYNESTGDFAYNIDDEGWDTEDSDLSAFAVLGK
jgi:hypothetical protein